MNYFEVLGVDVAASEKVIADAYKRLAKQFHPDQHPDATPAEKAAWTSMMARINEAWAVLGDDGKRAAYRDSVSDTPSRSTEETLRPPGRGECDLCGCAPAAPFQYRSQVAFLIAARMYSVGFELCRSCSLALGRSKQDRTLLTGWWGVLSFFRNFGVVLGNATNLRNAKSMPPPKKVKGVQAMLTNSLDPGTPLHLRFGVWVTVALLALGAFLLAQEKGTTGSNSSNYVPPAAAVQAPTWQVGYCVSGGSLVSVVPCAEPHVGMIVSSTFAASACPVSAESYVEVGARVWCIDENA